MGAGVSEGMTPSLQPLYPPGRFDKKKRQNTNETTSFSDHRAVRLILMASDLQPHRTCNLERKCVTVRKGREGKLNCVHINRVREKDNQEKRG